jgi:hypothetical protein
VTSISRFNYATHSGHPLSLHTHSTFVVHMHVSTYTELQPINPYTVEEILPSFTAGLIHSPTYRVVCVCCSVFVGIDQSNGVATLHPSDFLFLMPATSSSPSSHAFLIKESLFLCLVFHTSPIYPVDVSSVHTLFSSFLVSYSIPSIYVQCSIDDSILLPIFYLVQHIRCDCPSMPRPVVIYSPNHSSQSSNNILHQYTEYT